MIVCCVIILCVSLLSEYLNFICYFAAALICTALAVCMRKNRKRVLALTVLVIYFLSAAVTDLIYVAPCRKYDEISVAAEGVVTDKTASYGKDGVILKITQCEKLPNGAKVFVWLDKNEVSVGDLAAVNCCLVKTKSNMYSEGIVLSGHGATVRTAVGKYGIYKYSESIKKYVGNTVNTYCTDPSLALTMLTSDKDYMDTEDIGLIRSSGVSHVIVVSGMHMTVICSSAAFMFAFFRVKRKYSVPFLLLLVFTVCTVCGFTPSVLRAAIGYTVFLLAPYVGKRVSGIDSLCFACAVMLVFKPFIALDAGFQLSFASTFGILTLTPEILERMGTGRNRFLDILFGSVATSLGAYIAVLPVCILNFGFVSVVGLVVNVLVSYAVEVLLIAALLLLALKPLGVLFGKVIDLFTSYFYAVTRFFGSLPFANVFFRAEKLLGTLLIISLLVYFACKDKSILLKLKRGEKYDVRLGRNAEKSSAKR